MAVRSFDVGGVRGLRRAAADGLTNLVAIAGANGSGKSSLLDSLRSRRHEFLESGSELLFVGAHRTWRSGAVSQVAVLGFNFAYEDILKQDQIPGFQYQPPGGLHFLGGLPRNSSSADDAQALVKTALIRIANKQKDLLDREFTAQGGKIDPGSVPNLFTPFAELVTTLLPHLCWREVDASDPANIRCTFSPVDNETLRFDIDDLSSGEKAAVALFLPFIEREVRVLAGEAAEAVSGMVPITLVIDEPEIHLHPLLQLNVLDYMRRLASESRAQFIFTTHSPTLLDALEVEELFLLSPASLSPDNQLTRLGTEAERLELARSLTGSTHVLTRAKPIVFIEGEPDASATASDERLLRLLVPEVSHWALVPAGGKPQAIAAAKRMRTAPLSIPGVPVFALVDGDTSGESQLDYVVSWPVAMIENLLLDANSIADALMPYRAVTPATDVTSVVELLREVTESQVPAEIQLRVERALPRKFIRSEGLNAVEIIRRVRQESERLVTEITDAPVEDIVEQQRARVLAALEDGSFLNVFHGKNMLRAFYDRANVKETGLSRNAFVTEVARRAATSGRTRMLAAQAVARIRLYFPKGIEVRLQELDGLGIAELAHAADQCQSHRVAWERGEPEAAGREALRAAIFTIGRAAMGQRPAVAASVLELASQIGTS